jgi:zinc protease
LFASLLAGLTVSSTIALADATARPSPPATFTLANGLQVVVIQDHRTPVVTQMIW